MKIAGPDGQLDVEVAAKCFLKDEGDNEYSVVDTSGVDEGIVALAFDGAAVWVWDCGNIARFTLPEGHGEDTDHEARAPMTGKVVSMPVKVGDKVQRGDTVAVLEAMKMEYKLEAEADGTVEEIGAKVGELVDLGQLIVRLK